MTLLEILATIDRGESVTAGQARRAIEISALDARLAEREACAKIAESYFVMRDGEYTVPVVGHASRIIADEIRNRASGAQT